MNVKRQFILGFTMVELLVVIAIVSVLAALLIPAVSKAKDRAKTTACLSQLRQIGIASIGFAGENGDEFPAATMPNTNRFLTPLQPVYLEIRTPRIFVCPADNERIPETDSSSLNRTNTSYFVSRTARADQAMSILAGDRNITRIDFSNPGAPLGMPGRMTGNLILSRTNVFGWWRDMHRSKGNLLLADGSVQTTDEKKLNAQIALQPEPSFSWHIPNGDSIFTPFP